MRCGAGQCDVVGIACSVTDCCAPGSVHLVPFAGEIGAYGYPLDSANTESKVLEVER
jgi:hypothetical protein